MPLAANLMNILRTLGEPGQAAAPGAADQFAAMMADAGLPAGPPNESAGGEGVEVVTPASGEATTEASGPVDAATLLPMLDQQRATVPAAQIVAPAPEAVPQAPANAPAIQAPAVTVRSAAKSPSPSSTATAVEARDGGERPTPPIAAEQPAPAQPAKAVAPQPAQMETSDRAQPATPVAIAAVLPQTKAAPAKERAPAASAAVSQPEQLPATAVAARPIEPVALAPEAAIPPELSTLDLPPVAQSTPAAQTFPFPQTAPAAGTAAAATPAQPLAAALASQVLDMARGNEWIDTLARDIAQTASGEGVLRFKLNPETLGELRVEITQSDRGAHVRLHAGSEAAQQALADAQPRLAAEARAQGVRIAETEISFTGGNAQEREPGRQHETPQNTPARTLRTAAASAAAAETPAVAVPRRSDRYA
jgi:flagellar hook-length control protein FliK